MTTEQNMLDALIQHQVYSYRASTKVVNELQAQFVTASNVLSNRLRELLDELTDAEKNALTLGKYTTETLKEVKTAFDEWYQVMAVTLPETFAVSAVALAVYESSYISKLYGDEVDSEKIGSVIAKRIKVEPVVNGMKISDIWGDLATSTRKQAMYAVTEGIGSGLSNSEIISVLKGRRTKLPDGSFDYVGGIINTEKRKSDIDTNVRTVRSVISNDAYNLTFKALGFGFVKDIVTLDGRTSSTCRGVAAKDLIQPIDNIKFKPPYHFRCRTVQIGCNKDGKIDGKRPFVADTRSVKNIPKEERKDIIGQVDANVNYPEWFSKQSAVFQKEVLGPTKYDLYKNGGFTFDKFTDPLGMPYTIAELKSLDAATFKRLGL